MNQKTVAVIAVVVILIAAGIVYASKTSSNSNNSLLDNLTASNSATSNQEAGNSAAQSQATSSFAPQKLPEKYNKYQKAGFPGVLPASQLQNKKAVIQTAKGTIEFQLYPEASKAASNFIFLTNDHFYDGLDFWRRDEGFVIQGGDPLGNGQGGPGYTFTEDKLVYTKYDRGVVAMAKTELEPAGTGGSQFFIMLADYPLPPDYVIFGKVIKGMDVVDQIQIGDVMQKVTIEPLQ